MKTNKNIDDLIKPLRQQNLVAQAVVNANPATPETAQETDSFKAVENRAKGVMSQIGAIRERLEKAYENPIDPVLLDGVVASNEAESQGDEGGGVKV